MRKCIIDINILALVAIALLSFNRAASEQDITEAFKESLYTLSERLDDDSTYVQADSSVLGDYKSVVEEYEDGHGYSARSISLESYFNAQENDTYSKIKTIGVYHPEQDKHASILNSIINKIVHLELIALVCFDLYDIDSLDFNGTVRRTHSAIWKTAKPFETTSLKRLN